MHVSAGTLSSGFFHLGLLSSLQMNTEKTILSTILFIIHIFVLKLFYIIIKCHKCQQDKYSVGSTASPMEGSDIILSFFYVCWSGCKDAVGLMDL